MNLNKLQNKLEQYVNENPIEIEWDYNIKYEAQNVIQSMLEDYDSYINELYDYNIGYFLECEHYTKNNIFQEFYSELFEVFKNKFPNESKDYIEIEMMEYIADNIYFNWDLNLKQIFSILPDITVCIPIYSNYDCTNSFDTIETSNYMSEVWKAVKTGVRKKDFIVEHRNGAYGGSLFMFIFKTGIEDYLELKDKFKNEIIIPKNTQFGFHSTFQGASSPFEHTTYRNITLKKQYGKTNYDKIGIYADIETNYSIEDVFGDTNFIQESNVTVT